MFDLRQRITTDDRMELENQGNYLENQHQSANNNNNNINNINKS
jgi:hypothetical protein